MIQTHFALSPLFTRCVQGSNLLKVLIKLSTFDRWMVQPPIMFIDSESRSDLQVTIINGNQKLLSKTKKKPK